MKNDEYNTNNRGEKHMRFDPNILKHLSLISQIGLLMAIPIIGCILLGSFLDKLLGTNVIFLIIFTIVGVSAAFRNLFVISLKSSKKRKKDSK